MAQIAQALLPLLVLFLVLLLLHLAAIHGELAAERAARRMGDLRLHQLDLEAERERAPGPYRVSPLALDIVISRRGTGGCFARRGNGVGRGYGATPQQALADLVEAEQAARRPS